MGETGCGKTKLIDFMSKLQVPSELKQELKTMITVKVCNYIFYFLNTMLHPINKKSPENLSPFISKRNNFLQILGVREMSLLPFDENT